MEDEEIIRLYYARDEGAIRQTEKKYGIFCRQLAGNLLTAQEDAVLFVRRYWYGDGVKDLAAELGCIPNQVSQRLLKLRRTLKKDLVRP